VARVLFENKKDSAGGRQGLFDVIAALLHLSNVQFSTDSHGSTTALPACAAAPAAGAGAGAATTAAPIHRVEALLGVAPGSLGAALCTRRLHTRRSAAAMEYSVSLSVEQAEHGRDVTAQMTYSALIEWLAARLSDVSTAASVEPAITAIDLPGFESVARNGFQQLLINYGAVRLAALYVSTQVHALLSEYGSEEIAVPPEWSRSEAAASAARICGLSSLLGSWEQPAGILAAVAREGARPRAADTTLLERLHSCFGTHDQYLRPMMSRNAFIIRHGAADVSYDVSGFLDHNRARVSPDVVALLSGSRHALVATLASLLSGVVGSSSGDGAGAGFKHPSVARRWMAVIGALADEAATTCVSFVQCIRPSQIQTQRPEDIDCTFMGLQLATLGVEAAMGVTRLMFPHRYSFGGFYERFRKLMPMLRPLPVVGGVSASMSSMSGAMGAREACECLLTILKVPADQYRMGVTRLFVTAAVEQLLRRRMRHAGAVLLNRALRRLGGIGALRRHRSRRRKAIILAQSVARRWLATRRFHCGRAAVLTIQRRLRRHWRSRAPMARWEVAMAAETAVARRAATRRCPSRLIEPEAALAQRQERLDKLTQEVLSPGRDRDDGASLCALHGRWLAQTAALRASWANQHLVMTRSMLEGVEAEAACRARAGGLERLPMPMPAQAWQRSVELQLQGADLAHAVAQQAETAARAPQPACEGDLALSMLRHHLSSKQLAREQLKLHEAAAAHWHNVCLGLEAQHDLSIDRYHGPDV
jgi:myosin heavy subunit